MKTLSSLGFFCLVLGIGFAPLHGHSATSGQTVGVRCSINGHSGQFLEKPVTERFQVGDIDLQETFLSKWTFKFRWVNGVLSMQLVSPLGSSPALHNWSATQITAPFAPQPGMKFQQALTVKAVPGGVAYLKCMITQ